MSNESTKTKRRPYRKRRRAELEEETRLRITEAAVDLHGTVGPAQTTMSAVAERAGVQRSTLYRYFADETALFGACSAHWLSQNPLPDSGRWAEIEDPAERLRVALGELYEWFAAGEEMLERTIRDAPLVAAMKAPMDGLLAWSGWVVEVLMRGRPQRGARRRLKAAIGHAVAFSTWRSLVREQGLSNREAVALAEALIASAADGRA